MHYKNGREAKAGDIAVSLEHNIVGVLHTVNAGSETCNGRLAKVDQNDAYVTIGECLHIEDIKENAAKTPIVPNP